MATILIPAALRRFTQDEDQYETTSPSFSSAMVEFLSCYPAIQSYLFEQVDAEAGLFETTKFMNIYLNQVNIREIDLKNKALAEQDTVSLVPAMSGG